MSRPKLASILAVLLATLAVPAPALAQSEEELVRECRPAVEAQEREEAKYEAEEAEPPKWVLPAGCASERVYEETEEQVDESRSPELLVVGAHVKPLGALGAWYGVTLEIEEGASWGWIKVRVWGAMKRSYAWHLIPEGRGWGSVHLEWPCSPPHDGPIHYSVTETRGGKSITRLGRIQPRKARYCKRRAETERRLTESNIKRSEEERQREAAQHRREWEANCRAENGTPRTLNTGEGPERYCVAPNGGFLSVPEP